jgi:plastocyanin
MKKIVSLSALVLAVVLLAGCTSSTTPDENASGTSEMTAQTSAPANTDTTNGEAMDSSVKTIDMESFAFGFKPNTLEVKKGDKVKLNIKNTGGFHDFTLKDFNINVQTPANQVTTVEFTADKAGTFEFICSVGNHAQQGQKGTLVITE